MSVYAWIYANAKIEGDGKDYFTRVCGSGLEEYRSMLKSLSKRLLLANSGYRGAESQNCWFSGFLDEKRRMYFMAIGGEQERILGIPLTGDGFRTQYCVLGYGFTEEDIGLYRQDDAIFEPLKATLREIQRKGEDCDSKTIKIESQDFHPYAMKGEASNERGIYNIIKSTSATDEKIWRQSLQRPVMTGIVSVSEAKKLLHFFPNGIVSVMENVELTYVPNLEKPKESGISWSKSDAKEKERKQRVEALEKENEEKKRKLEQMELEAKSQKDENSFFEVILLFIQKFIQKAWILPVILFCLFLLQLLFHKIAH